jgi:formylglycine-generating enzyme required for sulfatase activity
MIAGVNAAHEIGQKWVNGLRLYDMCGNVCPIT